MTGDPDDERGVYAVLVVLFLAVLNAAIWFVYALLKKDVFMALPNVLGFVFGVALMACTGARSHRRRCRPGGGRARDQAAGARQGGAGHPQGRRGSAGGHKANCHAEVYTIDNVLPRRWWR